MNQTTVIMKTLWSAHGGVPGPAGRGQGLGSADHHRLLQPAARLARTCRMIMDVWMYEWMDGWMRWHLQGEARRDKPIHAS